MKNVRRTILVVLCIALVAAVMVGCAPRIETPAAPKFIRLGTASMGGAFYSMGNALAQTLNEKMKGINASAQATGGSAENCNFLQQGELELGMVQSATVNDAYNGKGQFNGRAIKDLRGLTSLYFMHFHVIVRDDAKVNTIADLKGKSIAVGPIGGGIEINTNHLLALYGIAPTDYKAVYGTTAEAVEVVKLGNADAFVYATGIGSAQVTDLLSGGGIKLLAMDADKVAEAVQKHPDFGSSVIPANTYRGQEKEIPTIAGAAILLTTVKMSEADAYNTVKTIFENNAHLVTFHQFFKETKPETATVAMPIPLHPGAEKYLKEKGIIK